VAQTRKHRRLPPQIRPENLAPEASAAYRKLTYEEVKTTFTDLHSQLQEINRSAARSLQEGHEEMLTLHRLGLFEEEVGRSLKTTNAIENLNSLIEEYTGNVNAN
jgi:transposase-like protein